MFCAGSAAHNFWRDHRARSKKMAAFCLRLDLTIEVNRHVLENEFSDLSIFSFFLIE